MSSPEISVPANRDNRVYEASRRVTYLLFGLPHFMTTDGAEHLPQEDPYILAFTHHSSYWDIAAVGQAVSQNTGRQINFLSKDDFDKVPVVRSFLAHGGVLPMNRKRYVHSQMETAKGVLDDGGIIGGGPEGTRKYGPELGDTRGGISILALMAQVPIVPAAVAGKEFKGRIRPRPFITPPFHVVVGEPLPAPEGRFEWDNTDDSTRRRSLIRAKRQTKELDANLHESLQALLNRARAA
jgi:1-acyl-sn-glycerol-3-phosphate acyltransferase